MVNSADYFLVLASEKIDSLLSVEQFCVGINICLKE
jgi:hypothetical protein